MQKQLMAWGASKTRALVYLLIALYLLLFIPFWKPVVLAFLFASACASLINVARKRFGARRSRVAYLTAGLSFAIIIGFVALVGLQIYSMIFEMFESNQASGEFTLKLTTLRDQIIGWASQQQFLESFNIREKIERGITGLTGALSRLFLDFGQAFIAAAPTILLDFLVFIGTFGTFLVIQPRIWENLSQALRLGKKGKEHFKRFEKICTLALGSVLLTALLQTILVVIGTQIAGFGNALMIFTVTFVASLIPVIGAGTVPFVLMVVALFQGDYAAAIVMLITCGIAGSSDNVLRAWLFSRAAKSNPILSIVTLLGGLALFGFPGLFIAPVIEQLVMTYAFSDEGEPRPGQTASETEPADPDKVVGDHPSQDGWLPI